MRVLVTSGATQTPIDKVRAITNIFKGRTGNAIACRFAEQGANVTLLASNPPTCDTEWTLADVWPLLEVVPFRTYDDLYREMKAHIRGGSYDVVIHSAAVSDYKVEGVYTRELPPHFPYLERVDSTKKVSSDAPELFLRLIPTEKIIDHIRGWGFKGTLVKFKLQVGISDEELLAIARKSMAHSDADLMVANCLEWSRERAFICHQGGCVENVIRRDLPERLLAACQTKAYLRQMARDMGGAK
jgi:phosphopantothenate-cysteine ligase/phosphopantothenoylcysteine decarboxylase/phosphopantothenate--cysteine ligase